MNGTNDENGGNDVNGWTYHARVNDRLRHLLHRQNYLADCKVEDVYKIIIVHSDGLLFSFG